MWGVIQTLIVSIGIIWTIHILIQYLQETYTVKKNKDMLSIYTEKYEKMLDDLTRHRKAEAMDPLAKIAEPPFADTNRAQETTPIVN